MAAPPSPTNRSTPSLRGWLPLLLFPTLVVAFFPRELPRWQFMWLLAFVIYAGFKWLTWRRTSAPLAPWWQQLGYLLLWPGMDAPTCLAARSPQRVPSPPASEWLLALLKFSTGALLFWGARHVVPPSQPLVLGWAGMTGLVMMLHFGSFHLLSCAWRGVGVAAQPLMNFPLLARGLAEFWGQRWNLAFRDLTYRFLFRPLTRRFGATTGMLAGFVASGLVHDLVISLPAGGGYGLPTLFFLVQGLGLVAERSPLGRRLGLGRGMVGWLFAAFLLALPAPLLFHPPFVERIILPFMATLGAA